jgi:hypothetical protein
MTSALIPQALVAQSVSAEQVGISSARVCPTDSHKIRIKTVIKVYETDHLIVNTSGNLMNYVVALQ